MWANMRVFAFAPVIDIVKEMYKEVRVPYITSFEKLPRKLNSTQTENSRNRSQIQA